MDDERPNILLIVTDQHRGDCLGIEGHPVLQTPTLDSLARNGTRFRRAYAECPSCIPARRSLMTGTAPAANGMVGFEYSDWDPEYTLAGELAKSGYETRLVGKLHLQPRRKRFGFDHMSLADGIGGETDYTAWLREQGETAPDLGGDHGVWGEYWAARPDTLPERRKHAYWCATEAVRYLTQQRDPTCPFFLNVSFFDPHTPFIPPRVHWDRYFHREMPRPAIGDWAPRFDHPEKGLGPYAPYARIDEQDLHDCRAAYYATIHFVDDQIGRILRTISSYDYALGKIVPRDTFILFISDHGEMLGDHHMFSKNLPYEGAARIPFLARAPARWGWPSEIECFSPVGLQDVMPTLLEAADLPIPETVTGKSLLPVMRGEASSLREIIHGEHAPHADPNNGSQFLVTGQMKYIWFTQTGGEQLFDLQKDPDELHDLALAAGDDADALLAPWRDRMISFLEGRPEGFTDGNRLIPGRPHHNLLPGYKSGSMYPFL